MTIQNSAFCQNSPAVVTELAVGDNISQLCIRVVDKPELVVEQWGFLQKSANDPFSSYAWVKAWYDAHIATPKCSPVIILGTDRHQKPLFLLPLFLQKIGPFNILLRPGRTHSAYFSGLFSAECRNLINADNADQFWKAIFSVVPFADVIAIDGVQDAELGQKNPLRFLPRLSSRNPSYMVLLSRDWEKLYQAKKNRKARANIRRCERRLSELGELHFRTGENEEECLAMLHIMLAQKTVQFRKHGIVNPYEMENISSFYERLLKNRKSSENHSLIVRALYLDDKPLAVNLGVTLGNEYHGLIMSMVQGPLARFSPGRILLLRSMQHLSEAGIERFDFGVGQANYKEGWVDNVIARHHVLAPLNIKGRVFVFGLRRAAAVKALIKSSNKAKELTKRARWNLNKD